MIAEVIASLSCVGVSWCGWACFRELGRMQMSERNAGLCPSRADYINATRMLSAGTPEGSRPGKYDEPQDALWRTRQLAAGAIVATISPSSARERQAELDQYAPERLCDHEVSSRMRLAVDLRLRVAEWMEEDRSSACTPREDPKLHPDRRETTEELVRTRLRQQEIDYHTKVQESWYQKYERQCDECAKLGIPHLPISAYRPKGR